MPACPVPYSEASNQVTQIVVAYVRPSAIFAMRVAGRAPSVARGPMARNGAGRRDPAPPESPARIRSRRLLRRRKSRVGLDGPEVDVVGGIDDRHRVVRPPVDRV